MSFSAAPPNISKFNLSSTICIHLEGISVQSCVETRISHCFPGILPLVEPRAILWRTRQEELQQLQNVPVVAPRLRRGALWGRSCPPAILAWRLRHPLTPIQSKHQLRGLLLHHAEAFKQGEQVHRVPWLLGVGPNKLTQCASSFTVCFCGSLCVGSALYC